jgi:hypothetical protein
LTSRNRSPIGALWPAASATGTFASGAMSNRSGLLAEPALDPVAHGSGLPAAASLALALAPEARTDEPRSRGASSVRALLQAMASTSAVRINTLIPSS